MALKLSKGQSLAIETKNKNILVSAAAGSGKTFVLTQRVLSRIIEDRWDIDSFLIVTFTRDAAAEMKDRIRKSLESVFKDEINKDNCNNALIKHIEKQLNLINRANISTIDSFCSSVVRQNFHKTELDLGYKNLDFADSTDLKKEAVDYVLESMLEEQSEDFMAFYNMYLDKSNDNKIVEMIFKLYECASNTPYPEKWLNACLLQYEKPNNFYESVWGKAFAEKIKDSIKKAREYADEVCSILRHCNKKPNVLMKLLDAVENFENAFKTGSLQNVAEQKISFQNRISGDYDPLSDEKLELLKGYIGFSKSALAEAKSYASISEEKSNTLFVLIKPVVRGLVKAEKEFIKKYNELKIERQLAEYNDISHSCLNILRNEDGSTTDVAKEYQSKFREIIIDEYQDSNYLQEEILTAVSRVETGENNIFMVGDVKQAIYKFRLTTPEIFMDKYNKYRHSENNEKLILLSENYRSRAVVLDACNTIFRQIMDKKIGNVEYTDEVALNPKADFPKADDSINISKSAEFLVVDTVNVDNGIAECSIKGNEGEAKVVANRIYEMLYTNPLYIYDKDIEKYRPVEKKDIVILVRTRTNAGLFYNALNSIGITCVFEKTNPLFATTEVKNVISLLRLIDNPLQDIDVINVIHCPMYGLSFDSITEIRLGDRKNRIYNVFKNAENKPVAVEKFLNDIEYYRNYAINNSVTDLINEIYIRSNYFNYVGILDEGSLKQSNLRLFKEKAMELEADSAIDLHSFIEYIDADLSDDVRDADKVGSAREVSASEDAVRIITIHKSKGLEYPVVFVSLLHENIKSYGNEYIFDRELGIGLKFIDRQNRIRYDTMPFNIIADRYNQDEKSETLRLLYVALTRAREKLIMTGVTSTKKVKSDENKYNVLNRFAGDKNMLLPYDLRKRAESPLFWIISSLKRLDFDTNNVFEQKWVCLENVKDLGELKSDLDFNILEKLNEMDNAKITGKYSDIIKEKLEYNYTYATDTILPSKISITEIKRKLNAQNDNSVHFYKSKLTSVPDVMKKADKITSAQLGTIYHTVMEHINFSGENNGDTLLDNLCVRGILSDEERNAVDTEKINAFINSDLYLRIKSASAVYTESPFVMSINASRLNEYSDTDSDIVVHGIIDLYFEENNELVLLDYKTDWVKNSVEELRNKYKVQLELYKEALEKNTGKRVKECIIYSLYKGECVSV